MKYAIGSISSIACPSCGYSMQSKASLKDDKAEVWCANSYSCSEIDKKYIVRLPKYELFEKEEQ